VIRRTLRLAPVAPPRAWIAPPRAWIAPLLACVAPLLISACGPTGGSPRAIQPTEQAQSMARMTGNVNTLRAYTRGEGGRDDALLAARELAGWSSRMRELFPPEKVMALYLDLTPEMARTAPDAMRRTAERLTSVVRTGTRAQAGQALVVTEAEGCGACHRHGYQ
jgi:hypothetical protein